jgi:hypothetical protein
MLCSKPAASITAKGMSRLNLPVQKAPHTQLKCSLQCEQFLLESTKKVKFKFKDKLNYVRMDPIEDRLCMPWECWLQTNTGTELNHAEQLELTVTLAAAENELYAIRWEKECVRIVLRKVRTRSSCLWTHYT